MATMNNVIRFRAALAFRDAVREANRCWGGASIDRDIRNSAWLACRDAHTSTLNTSAAAERGKQAALKILIRQ